MSLGGCFLCTLEYNHIQGFGRVEFTFFTDVNVLNDRINRNNWDVFLFENIRSDFSVSDFDIIFNKYAECRYEKRLILSCCQFLSNHFEVCIETFLLIH